MPFEFIRPKTKRAIYQGIIAAFVFTVAPDNCSHAQTVDSPTVTEVRAVAPADCSHTHTIDSFTLGSIHVSVPDNCSHAHTVDSDTVVQVQDIDPVDCSNDQTVGSPTFDFYHTVYVDSGATDSFTSGTDDPVNLRTTSAAQKLSQGFLTTKPYGLYQVTVYLSKAGSPTGNIWVELWSNSGTKPSALLQTSGTMDVSTVGASKTAYTFTFGTIQTLADASYYHIVLCADYAYSVVNYAKFWGDDAAGYAGGNSYRWEYLSSEWIPVSPNDFYFITWTTGNTFATSVDVVTLTLPEAVPVSANSFIDHLCSSATLDTILVPASPSIVTSVSEPTLTEVESLSFANSSISLSSSEPSVSGYGTVTPADCSHSITDVYYDEADYSWVDILKPVTKKTPMWPKVKRGSATSYLYVESSASASHAQSVDSPTLTVYGTQSISPNNASHSQTVDAVIISSPPGVIADDTSHAQSVGVIGALWIITANDASHSQSVTETLPILSGIYLKILKPCDDYTPWIGPIFLGGESPIEIPLSIWPGEIDQTVSGPTVTQVSTVTPNDGTVVISDGGTNTWEGYTVYPVDCSHAQTVDAATVTMVHIVSPNAARNRTYVSSPTVTGRHYISPNNGTIVLSSQNTTVSSGVNNTSHAQSVSSPSVLTISDSAGKFVSKDIIRTFTSSSRAITFNSLSRTMAFVTKPIVQ